MRLSGLARSWNTTAAERAAVYPCDGYLSEPGEDYFRAITVNASAARTFRWVCQLRVAPYSYDWVDNRGRRSPRTLTPGADRLAPGDRFLIVRIVDVDPGRHVSGVATPEAERRFGQIALTYAVLPRSPGGCRIVVKLRLGQRGRFGRLGRAALALGDLVMMRKQLMTLRDLAERDERHESGSRT